MKSLRTKMTIMIVLVVLSSSVLLSFISYQKAKESLIDQMEVSYGVAAQKYALELSSWVSTNATIIDTLAAEVAVNDISTKDYETFHNYLRHSNEILNKNGFVYDVYFTYPNNFMVCASDFVADGTVDFVHEREWYTNSALTGELFYSTPYLDSDTNKPIITISKAVYKNDELLGVLAADIFVDVIVDMVNNANVEEDSYAFLVDQNMRMLVHPNKAYDYDDMPINVMDIPGAPYGELIDSIRTNSDEMIFVKDYDGVTRGITYSQMINTGWYICIATSKKVLSSGVDSMMNGFVIATVVAIVIGVITAIFLAHVLDKLNKQEQEYKERVLKLEKQAADEANEAKSRFLADMSHEIRTPINAIIGMNEMILRESHDKDIRGYSQNIKQSGHNLLQLINGILDFSKIEDGKMEIVPVRYNVSSQITYLYNGVSERAKAKNLELIFDIDPEIPSELYGDDTRINQVVMNLLTNAVKYTEKGSVTLKISRKENAVHDGNVILYFEVKDTGIGIKESDMSRLFESFERLDVVKNRNIEGTGLGMNITRKLLELMGSELKVESEYGVGSTFSFELLLRVENSEPMGDYRVALKEDDTESYKESFRAPEARVLVVDDTEMNIIVVMNLLKKTDVKIDTALSGPDSIQLAEENAYDIILMDQRMPGMDGTEAMNEIRALANGKNKTTPMICLTADVIRGARDRYIGMGFDDYLTKPVEGAELEKMLIKYLPGDKVEITTDEKSIRNDNSKKDDSYFAELTKVGVDINSGMTFCGGDIEMYKTILDAFVKEEKTKAPNILKSYEDKNWKDYGIYVHSLKSTSRTIGADKLSELAAMSEAAAKGGDIDTINKNHNQIMEMYAELVNVIKINMESAEDEESQEDDSEILEFFPEDT